MASQCSKQELPSEERVESESESSEQIDTCSCGGSENAANWLSSLPHSMDTVGCVIVERCGPPPLWWLRSRDLRNRGGLITGFSGLVMFVKEERMISKLAQS